MITKFGFDYETITAFSVHMEIRKKLFKKPQIFKRKKDNFYFDLQLEVTKKT